MPANLPSDSKSKWLKASQAKDPEEKIKALQEFLTSIPKHKGNERLRKQVKRKIATLRLELQEKKAKKKTSAGKSLPREGAARILILSETNAGKSSLLKALTNANPTVASYPYTTTKPIPGMMRYQDIQIQLIEVPSTPQTTPPPQTLNLIRSADAIILLIDISASPHVQLKTLLQTIDQAKVTPTPLKSKVELRKGDEKDLRIHISGRLLDCTAEDLRKFLNEFGVKKGVLNAYGDITLQYVEEVLLQSNKEYKPLLIIGNKIDTIPQEALEPAPVNLPQCSSFIYISCKTREGLQKVPEEAFKTLNIIRVYTKYPGRRDKAGEPFILNKDSTVGDLARNIHSQLYKNFKYARLWGPSSSHQGEKVGEAHYLKDGDTVEVHTR